MTLIKPYHAECLDCGHIMPLKMQLLSYNSRVGIPEDMDLSNKCDECGSENLKFTSLDEAMENMKDNNTTEKP